MSARLVVVPKHLEERLRPALCDESTVDLEQHLRATATVVLRAKAAALRAHVQRNEAFAEVVKRRMLESPA